jgi:hypothetical protein
MAHSFYRHTANKAGHARARQIMKANGGACGGSDNMPFSSAGVQDRRTRKAAGGKTTYGKSAARQEHDALAEGGKSPKRFAKGGKVKPSHQTNIVVVAGRHPPGAAMGAGAPQMAGPPGMPPGAPPPGMMPGAPPGMMPMRKSGGRIKKADGGDTGGMSDVQPLQITPQIRARMERRLQNAEGDEEVQRVIKDAARYGVDWSNYGRARGGRLPSAGAGSGIARIEKAEWSKRHHGE